MPRKSYPSDHRRWFRVREDILDDPKLEDCSADVFRFYFRLLAMLNRTKSRDGTISLSRAALNLCAGREQLRHSLRVARGGAEAGLYRVRVDGAQTVIWVPKWAETQEFTPAQLQSKPDATPPTTPTPTTTPKTTPTSDGAIAPTPWAEPFVRLLKGETPTGLSGETWDTPADWLGFHESLIRAEAEFKAEGETEGKKFTAAFKAIMMRFWNSKTPPSRGNGAPPKETKAEEIDRLGKEFIREDRIRLGLDPDEV